ncbi:MAG: HEPN domain-containing protein [Candidatus Aenigmatarchaeota archaeon]
MANLEWCKKQSSGLQKVEPSENIAEDHFRSAEESLKVLRKVMDGSRMWAATVKYYVEYFCVSAVLSRLGVKSEIHDCTIAAVEFLEEEGVFQQGTTRRLEKSKELRIDNQYNLKERSVELDLEELSDFILETKEIMEGLHRKRVNELRSKLFR